jgi:hypothetical protein
VAYFKIFLSVETETEEVHEYLMQTNSNRIEIRNGNFEKENY